MVTQNEEDIGYKEVGDYSFREHFVLLGKRIVAMPSKMIGFKPACLYLATWLLVIDKIGPWVWFSVMVSVLFGIIGLKVITKINLRSMDE